MKHKHTARPKLYISKCIETCACRYDGQKVNSDFVFKLMKFADTVTECPETAIGLGTPRKPVRIVSDDAKMHGLRLIQPETGADFTEKMNVWAHSYLKKLGEVDGFVLKSKSPSSGFKDVKIYGKNGMMLTKKGAGFFGGKVPEYYPGIPVEDEARLLNSAIRDHFLKSIFAIAAFREAEKGGKISGLLKYHSENKLLFMSYNQVLMRKMGRLLSAHGNKKYTELCTEYKEHLLNVLSSMPKVSNTVNTMMHAFGYFKTGISADEKTFFLQMLEKYQKGKIIPALPLNILKLFAVRFNEEYLLSQTFFEPYPEELAGGD
ncbi:MAG TPA: DUF523 and DUF1722 domain-containing protein [Candidatus Goldiibacteriota bacterium]|nr:DUF523 and DUF1722 domain-containing protein [Candidatus Goldiibacteriota bacterium]HRQ44302.1 DUF523 and DUF1722 domain-containing protein [Candidatus Goldiibacteriota bacterium]